MFIYVCVCIHKYIFIVPCMINENGAMNLKVGKERETGECGVKKEMVKMM